MCVCVSVSVCEGQGGHPMLFWDVATGLGGVVGKKGAGDGDSFVSTPKHVYIQYTNIESKTQRWPQSTCYRLE